MGTLKTFITGSKYHQGAETACSFLEQDDLVYLVRDPENKFDKNAVRVQTAEGQMLGHIPMDLSELVSDMILLDIIQAQARILEAGRKGIAIEYDLLNEGAPMEGIATSDLGEDTQDKDMEK